MIAKCVDALPKLNISSNATVCNQLQNCLNLEWQFC